MVKANGYGHGAAQVALAAETAGATWQGVATIDEAEELREAGIPSRILIVGPLTGTDLVRAKRADADIVVWTKRLCAEALGLGLSVHVKLDSGMGRLGTDEAAADELVQMAASRSASLGGLMTHFASADGQDRSLFERQLAVFRAWVAKNHRLAPSAIVHAANSAATLTEPRSWFGMIRCGIAMYGLSPWNDDPDRFSLRPALRLSSYVADIREFQPGATIGYGATFEVQRPSRIAAVPIGYADGVSRLLSNRGTVLIHGHRCRIVGRVSMDLVTVELLDGIGKVGQEVVLIGSSGNERVLCEEMAQTRDTIVNEVVCDLGPRIAREYVSQQQPAV